MPDLQSLVFEPYRLDLSREQLWRDQEVIPLTNKAFAVLLYLVEHAEQLVTRDGLMEAVWPGIFVSDAALTVCIHELRQALDENPQAPRFIETVRGRGYRFLVPVSVLHPSPTGRDFPPANDAPSSASNLVGRQVELDQLHACYADALRGKRQIVFVTGEAGIGKTSLVDAFIDQVETAGQQWIGHGQCIEQYGAGEAYLPLLEALGRLCRGSEGEHLIGLLAQQAPSWLVQMPALLSPDEFELLQRRGGGATRERMLRELADAVETLTADRPLMLVLEDLHWSDSSTLDWIAYVARRRDRARLLVLGTYRPVEAIVQSSPLRAIAQELHRHGQCVELLLDYLSEAGLEAYLTQRFDAHVLPQGLIRVLHQRTRGNPLFLVNLVDDLVRQGLLQAGDEGWTLRGTIDTVSVEVPESLRQLIEHQLEHVSPEENSILEAASVAGMEFSVSAVAAAISVPEEEVEACCTTLVRRTQFLQSKGTVAWPDGTVSARCGFVHALYQEVLYERVPPGRRGRLHQQIGTRLEAGYASQTQEIAAELAEHFVQGADTSRATQYLIRAGENALQRSAYQEAMSHLTQGLDLLTSLPNLRERSQYELSLQSSLGGALIAAKGYAWPETGQAFARARDLCTQLGETDQLSTVQYGLCLFHLDRGEMIQAQAVAEEALRMAQRETDSTALLLSHRLVGTCHYFLGRLVSARDHLEQALSLYDPEQHRPLMFVYAADVRVAILSWLNRVLLLLGYPQQAHVRSTEALAFARDLSHPHSVAYAMRDSCHILQIQHGQETVLDRAEAVMSLASEQGFAYELEEGRIYRGWALAESGHIEEGITDIQRGIASYQAMGSEFQIPYFLVLLAHVYGQTGREAEGLELINEALDRVERTQERWIEAELYRLKGNLLSSHAIAVDEEAGACFYRASEVAQQQNARLFTLRATVSLARWLRDQGKPNEARQHLGPVYAEFTEGFDTPDLREAKQLLEDLNTV